MDLIGRESMGRAKRHVARNGLDFQFERSKGKGSHCQLYLGCRANAVKRSDLSQGLSRNVLRDLGIKEEDF